MSISPARRFGQRYAFAVVAVVFLALLIAAAQRSAPSVLLAPLEKAFGWTRDVTSMSAAVGIFLYGMVGPFAAALMAKIGVRRTLFGALGMMSLGTFLSLFMTQSWQLVATWGAISGLGTGAISMVLGATIVNRWFVSHRGLVMGILTASTATGNLVFLPVLAWLAEYEGWRSVATVAAIAPLVLIPLIWYLLPETPASIGLTRYGATPDTPPLARPASAGLLSMTFGTLAVAARTRTFWFLFATFFICGFTTNGLIGTHLIALCGDHGIEQVQAAGLLAAMGICDLIGTTLSGWLTDRFDSRKLLFAYYGLRGLSLIYLPYSDFSLYSLSFFAIFYGLDWIATVPPTLKLATEAYGERQAPVVFGWIAAGHQIGAASAAFLAGYMRQTQGTYLWAFVIAGATGVLAAVLALLIARAPSLPAPLEGKAA